MVDCAKRSRSVLEDAERRTPPETKKEEEDAFGCRHPLFRGGGSDGDTAATGVSRLPRLGAAAVAMAAGGFHPWKKDDDESTITTVDAAATTAAAAAATMSTAARHKKKEQHE